MCADKPPKPQRRFFHYDDIFNSMETLFVISTKDRWVMLMWQAADAQVTSLNPIYIYISININIYI